MHAVWPCVVLTVTLTLTSLHVCTSQRLFVMNQRIEEPKAGEPSKMLIRHAGVEHQGQKQKLTSALDQVPSEAFVFKSDKLSSDQRLRPSVGNGHIATVVHGPEMHMNGLYNGYMNQSTRAVIPSMANINISGVAPPAEFTRNYELNVAEGVYIERLVSADFTIVQRLYAHRVINALMVTEIELIVASGNEDRLPDSILLDAPQWKGYGDVNFTAEPSGMNHVKHMKGHIVAPETKTSGHTPVNVFYDEVPQELKVSYPTKPEVGEFKSVTWVFLVSTHANAVLAKKGYQEGLKLLQFYGGLYPSHAKAWLDTWERGRVDVEGDLKLAQAIYGSYYAILSSIPLMEDLEWPFIGLSPGGLPWGAHEDDYMGHVFWDQDMWMYPGVLMMHADLGKILINTRTRTMKAALQNAKNYGYSGMKFPWESAFSGLETCPAEIYSKNELHINGDVIFAILQYLHATGNYDIIVQDGFGKLIIGVGDFWLSKVEYDSVTKTYNIKGVMPPDEYNADINNSVFTNVVARVSLYAAEFAAKELKQPSEKYKTVADALYIPFDSAKQYHPEYEGYELGTTVKQADVVLLGFPLMHNMSQTVRSNDLDNYASVTDPDGPAMTWGMFAIGWLELKELNKAAQYFHNSYQPYIANEFQVWTEQTKQRGCANFITGAGGFLQAIIFGYGGLRLQEGQLLLDPELPPGTSALNLRGLDYRGKSLDIEVTKDWLEVTRRAGGTSEVRLELVEDSSSKAHELVPGSAVRVARRKCAIKPKKTT